jgi:hypothetical protein
MNFFFEKKNTQDVRRVVHVGRRLGAIIICHKFSKSESTNQQYDLQAMRSLFRLSGLLYISAIVWGAGYGKSAPHYVSDEVEQVHHMSATIFVMNGLDVMCSRQ